MKKRLLPILLAMLLVVPLTGCDIKFIEKVESEPSTVEKTEEEFGSIIIEESTKTEIKDSTENTESASETEESMDTASQLSEELPPEPSGNFKYNGVDFVKDDQNPTMWVASDCPAKTKPDMESQDYTFLYKGDFVTVSAVSTDNRWAMVSIYGGPASFVEYENLTFEEVIVNSMVSELSTEQSELPSSEISSEIASEQTSEQTTPQTIEPTTEQIPTQEPTYEEPSYEEPSYEEPIDTYTGIAFPSNASSTSFNMGVEFADVTVTLSVRKDGAVISNGPDSPSNSSGYYAIASLDTGTTVKCTGIGTNGYIRVEYNGQIGFMDSRYVEY